MRNRFPDLGEVFFALCKSVDSPISLGLWLRYKYGEYRAIAEFELPIRDYTDVTRFKGDYLVASYLSKCKGLNTGIDLKSVALSRFASSEVSCRATNDRIRGASKKGFSTLTEQVVHLAQRKIARLLGPFSLFCVESGVGWGPGATDDIPRRRAYLDTKMHELPISVSRSALALGRSMIESDLHWSAAVLDVTVDQVALGYSLLPTVFRITEDCVVDVVPKSAKTHRTIAKEPRLNSFLQKGFGQFIRRRLKSVGIDLDNQQPNQQGAARAYTEGLATLDLKAASDSIATELVYLLCPVDWALALDDIRSKYAKLPNGDRVRLEKFSSMGNGFTFELESLIFWAISTGVRDVITTEGEVLVYGDDIIVPEDCAAPLVDVLTELGFETNPSKSFLSGNFFESCGKHFFQGCDVTPIYQKEPILSYPEMIRAANRLMRYFRGPSPAWYALRNYAAESVCFQLPLGATGDDGWVLPASLFKGTLDPNHGFHCLVMAPDKTSFPAHPPSLLAWVLRSGDPGVARKDTLESPAELRALPPFRKRRRWVHPTEEFGLIS